MVKKHIDRALLALFAVMAVLLFISTASYPGIAQKTSAYYVKFLAVFFGTLCVAQLALSFLREKDNARLYLTDNMPRFGGLLACLIIFAVVFEKLGFFISAGVFIPVVSFLLGYRNYLVIALVTAGVLAFVYAVFVKLLSVNLPGFNF